MLIGSNKDNTNEQIQGSNKIYKRNQIKQDTSGDGEIVKLYALGAL